MKLKGNFFIRKIGNENFAMLIDTIGQGTNKMIRCNDSSKIILEMLEIGTTLEQIADAFVNKYDVEKSVAMADIKEVVEKLNEIGFIEE